MGLHKQERQIQEMRSKSQREENRIATLNEERLAEVEDLQKQMRYTRRASDVRALQTWEQRESEIAAEATRKEAEIEQLQSFHSKGEQHAAGLVAEYAAELEEMRNRNAGGRRPSTMLQEYAALQDNKEKATVESAEASRLRQSEMQMAVQVQQQQQEIAAMQALMRQQEQERAQQIADLTVQLDNVAHQQPAQQLVQDYAAAEEVEELEETDQPQAPPEPASPPMVQPPYTAEGDDELDQLLEAQLTELGQDVLKGNTLVRTGPSKYKLGDKRVFMKLTDGAVTVRDGSKYVSLQQWTEGIEAADDGDNAEMFNAMNAASPYAQHE